MSPDSPLEAMVPVWALTLTADVAQIKARTETIPDLQRELEGLKVTMVPMAEHQRMLGRVDALWDDRNAAQGAEKTRSRSEALWRAGLTLALAALALYVAAHEAGFHMGF